MATIPTQQILSIQEGPEIRSEWILKNWATQHEILPHFSKFSVTADFGPLVGNVDLLFSLKGPNQGPPDFTHSEMPYYFPTPHMTTSDWTTPGIPNATTKYLFLWLTMKKPTVPVNQMQHDIAFKLSADFNNSPVHNVENRLVKTNIPCNNTILIVQRFVPYKTGNHLAINTENLNISLKIVPIFPVTDVPPRPLKLDTKFLCDIPCDIRFEMSDGTVLNMHSAILGDKSVLLRDVFCKAMQTPDFDGVMKIEKWTGKVMMDILRFIYTGKLPTTKETGTNWKDVLQAASEMKIVDLKAKIEDKLVSSCTKENMFQLYADAKSSGLENAVEKIAKFIKENL